MMVFRLLPLALVLSIGSLPLNIMGSEVSGTIEGKVIDGESRLPLSGVRIQLVGTERVTESDKNGTFRLSYLVPGTYGLMIRKAGYEEVIRGGITLPPGKTLFLNIEMQEKIEIVYTFDEIVVTATRIEEKISDIDGSVSVVTERDIGGVPAHNIVDIIDILPGFQSYTADGNRMTPGINVRGFTGGGLTEYLQVLLDGVPINDLETGLVNWNMIPVGEIERIEVLRGPSSALYGDMAVGGVINVITQEPKPKPSAEVTLNGGSFGEYGGGIRLTDVFRKVGCALSGSRQQMDGWREHSRWRREILGGRIGSPLGKGWRMSLFLDNQLLKKEIPGPLSRAQLRENREQASTPWDEEDQRRHLLLLTFDRERQGGSGVTGSVFFKYKDDDLFRTLFSETKEHEKRVHSFGLTGQYNRAISWKNIHHHFVFGSELEGGRMTSRYYDLDDRGKRAGGPSAGGAGNRTKTALYLQHKMSPGKGISLTLGLRWDGIYDSYLGEVGSTEHFDSDKSAFSTKIGTNWTFGQSGRVYAHLGRAFKAPTMEQLFDQRPFFHPYENRFLFLSNSELKPQKGTNYEVGLNWKGSPLFETHVAAYRMHMNDEIDFDLGRLTYANIGRSRHQGIESELKLYPSSHINGFLNYTYTEATYTSGENQGNQINTIPFHVVNVGFLLKSNWGGGASVLVNSVKDQYLDGENIHPLANYTTVDLRLSYEREPVHLSVDVKNVLDREYSSFGYVDPFTMQEMLFPASERSLRGEVKIVL